MLDQDGKDLPAGLRGVQRMVDVWEYGQPEGRLLAKLAQCPAFAPSDDPADIRAAYYERVGPTTGHLTQEQCRAGPR